MTKHSVSYPEATSSTSHKDYNTFANISVRFSQPENSRPLGNFGQCEECGGLNTGGDDEIDRFIKEAQSHATNFRSVLEWIKYQEFTNVKHLADGGNSTVFTANWLQGPIQAWNKSINDWERQTNLGLIILKRIKDSNNLTSSFMNELSAYHKFSTMVSNVMYCYGISRCPCTRELIVVTSYARDGDLRNYLTKNFDTFTWTQKISTLKDIASGLVKIHSNGLLHKDLHTGNILRHGSWTMISDLGTRPEITSEIPDYYSIVMQSCWNNNPKMRPTSRDLEKRFDSWINSIKDRQLICPEISAKEKADVNDSACKWIDSYRNISSQPLPSLSVIQCKILEEQDECHEALYQKYYNQRLIEHAERESKIKENEPMNPMTWTRELKILADNIFGKSDIDNKLELTGVKSIEEANAIQEVTYDIPVGIRIGIKSECILLYYLRY
ncbi:16721_t:CDS:2 [Funneliformis caledonium]|uniref:16721_t:CDS:1 n=1 Tax=Funneliformis caledonium TaxID=1117310 RepID=A0A9N9CUR7_9GLOM|nr:16721_t:CDS:2 [Funneliformis caledonium]